MSTGKNIYAQRINASGVALWPVIYNPIGVPITTQTLDQEVPVIASDGAGGAFIAWQNETGPREEHLEI